MLLRGRRWQECFDRQGLHRKIPRAGRSSAALWFYCIACRCGRVYGSEGDRYQFSWQDLRSEQLTAFCHREADDFVKGMEEQKFMTWMKTYRTVVLINLLVIFAQFGLAGQMLGGRGSAVAIHGLTGVLLVLIAFVQAALSIVLKAKSIGPTWLVVANVGIIVAEVIEAACGHFHNLAVHVPLALAIFGGLMRQLFWAMREASAASELRV
jgi:hypothetical protein